MPPLTLLNALKFDYPKNLNSLKREHCRRSQHEYIMFLLGLNHSHLFIL